MRILFINSIQMFGGGEVWLLTMMRELKNRGHHVHLICRQQVPLMARACEQGFTVYPLPMRGDFDPVTIAKTCRLMRQLKIDAVCTNMDKELRFGGLAAKLAGVKAVVPRRGIDYPLKNAWAYRFSYNYLASGIIANSISTKDALLKNCPWMQAEKIKVIYNGVNPDRFSSKPRIDLRNVLGIKKDDFLIGFVGQLNERKGVDTLIRAFTLFSKRNKKAALLLTGEGNMENMCRQMVQKCPGDVIFSGYREDIEEVMKTIDVLVLPSLWEGFGIVLIEAMSAGKPVITTAVSNMPEIVSQGIEGLLVPPGDENGLAEAFMKLYRNPLLARKMGKAGRQRVIKQFTLQRMVDETEDYILKLIAI